MNYIKAIRRFHLASTVWFMLCTGYVFILALRQAGFNWLAIFSLSGYWALMVTLLVSLYLFAIFRGAPKGHGVQTEHPLTSTKYYMAFYVSTPFLGAIGGVLAMTGQMASSMPGVVALGTIGATFLTWVFIDPIASSVELLAPQPRRHRAQRLARAKERKQRAQADREQLLANILEQECENESRWRSMFAYKASRLADLLAADTSDLAEAESEVINIGVEAWRAGGLACMRQLRAMASEAFRQQYGRRQFVDYISGWWDGIGRWREPSLVLT